MIEVHLSLSKNNVLKIIFTSFTFIFTVLIPFISFMQFNFTEFKGVSIGNWEYLFLFVIFASIIIGVFSTISRYFIYSFPKYSVKKHIIVLLNSILFIAFLIVNSFLGKINLVSGNFYLSLDFTGLFLLLIAIWSLFLVKNVFDLIDFKVNEKFYTKLIRENSKMSSKLKSDLGFKNLIKCHNCGYMCRISWKKCPICQSFIKKKVVDIRKRGDLFH